MKVPYFDAHCDTLSRMAYLPGTHLERRTGQWDLEKLSRFDGPKAQIFAVFCDSVLPGASRAAERQIAVFRRECERNQDRVVPCVDTSQAEQAFAEGVAAMRFDGSDLAETLAAERQGKTVVVSLSGMDGQARTALVGTPSYGLAITRACWQDSARREAALSLAAKMLTGEGFAALTAPASDTALGQSIAQMNASATACAGLLYDLNPDHFDEWSESVVSALMAL